MRYRGKEVEMEGRPLDLVVWGEGEVRPHVITGTGTKGGGRSPRQGRYREKARAQSAFREPR